MTVSADPEPSARPPVPAKRIRVSRVTLATAGVLALVAFLWVPFLKAGNTYRAVVAPAYRVGG